MKSIILFLTVISIVLFTSCTKNVERTGCMDPLAVNFSTLADIDDGSCEYEYKEQIIWRNGAPGAWDENFIEGGIAIMPCIGSYSIDTVGFDTSGVAIRAMVIKKDTNDRFGITGRLVNQKDGRGFVNGFLRFDAMLPSGSALSILDVAIHGGNCFKFGDCTQVCRSGVQQVVTFHLSDTVFTEVALPLLDFPNRKFAILSNLFMFSQEVPLGTDEVLIINNIRWTNM